MSEPSEGMVEAVIGRKQSFDEIQYDLAPAGWAKVPEGTKQFELGLRWYVRYGVLGSITASSHMVTEHDDGTITVTPSLVMPPRGREAPERWHGWLTCGEFQGSFEPVPADE